MSSEDGDRSLPPLDLLRDVARWSVWVTAAVVLVGGAVTRSPAFVAGCVLGAAVDIGSVWLALGRAGTVDLSSLAGRGVVFTAGRLLLKGGMLALAFAFPSWLGPWGTLAGVLVYESVLVTAGAWVSLRRGFGHGVVHGT